MKLSPHAAPRSVFAASLTGLVTALVCAGPEARAGSIEYLSNQSADYIRSFSRNAAIDGPDIIAYNPAGTVFLNKGLHAGLSSQTLIGQYGIRYKGRKYTADVMVPVLPSLFAAWNAGSWAVFGAFTVPAGGGSLTYDKGIPYLIPLVNYADHPDGRDPEDGVFGGSSIFYGGTLGAAYKILGLASVSLGARLTMADKSFDGHATYGTKLAELHTTKSATGVTLIGGLCVRPGFGLTLGARYEMKTAMEFTASTTMKNLQPMDSWRDGPLEAFADGAKEKRDMPAVLGLGAAWESPWGINLSTSYHRYFTADADPTKDYAGIPGTGGMGAFVRGWDDDYDKSWDMAVSAEYEVSDSLVVSLGYIHTVIGGNKKTYSDFEYALDSDSVGGGARLRLTKLLALTLGVSDSIYKDGKNNDLVVLAAPGPETFSKSVIDVALGVSMNL